MKRKFGNSIILLTLLISVTLLVITQYTPYSLSYKIFSDPKVVRSKYILYWTEMFGRADFNLGFGSKIFQECPVNNCYATNNKSYVPVDQFDAILFHGVEYSMELHGRPENRSPSQYYVYSNQESPVNTPHFPNLSNFFNWTMTYRLNSDIVRPYGYYKKGKTPYILPSIEEVQRKPYKIAWMVSNCETLSLRKILYKKLNKHIQVDVYGSCGNKTCSKQDWEKCYKFLEDNYKFYLSFENSICKDYVTEKLYNVLKRNLLPIVYGGGNYEKLAPPMSVIDVTKFNSMKDLAKYIIYLDKNPKEYFEYFKWKKDFVVETNNKRTLCSLCAKLNQPTQHKSYTDIYKWWSFQDMCKYGTSLPKIIFT